MTRTYPFIILIETNRCENITRAEHLWKFDFIVVWQLVFFPPNPIQELWDWPLLFTFTLLLSDALYFTTPSLPFAQVCSFSPTQICQMSLINIKGFSLCVAVYHYRPPRRFPLLCSRRIGHDNYASGDYPIIQINKICLLFFTFSCTHLVQNLNFLVPQRFQLLSNYVYQHR